MDMRFQRTSENDQMKSILSKKQRYILRSQDLKRMDLLSPSMKMRAVEKEEPITESQKQALPITTKNVWNGI